MIVAETYFRMRFADRACDNYPQLPGQPYLLSSPIVWGVSSIAFYAGDNCNSTFVQMVRRG